MPLKKKELESYIDSHLKTSLEKINIYSLPSLSELGRKFGNVDAKTISVFLKDQYLSKKYNSDRAKNIYNKFWGSRYPQKNIDEKKKHFFSYMKEIMNLYKDGKEISNDIGVRVLARKFNVNRMTVPNWIKKLIKQWLIDNIQLNVNISELNKLKNYIISEIWGIRCNKIRKITYEDIEKIISKRGGIILTSKIKFDKLVNMPTERYIKIKCGKNHKFKTKVRCLIYDYNWCPICNEYICEKIMRNYMNFLFKNQLKAQVRLSQVLDIKKNKIIYQTIILNNKKFCIPVHVGLQRYDCFNSNLKLNGKDGRIYTFRVAGEYDGIQHFEEDITKNPYCSTRYDVAKMKARDLAKNKASIENNVILIRLKESKGFNRRVMICKQYLVLNEITKQFNSQIYLLFSHRNIRLKYNPNIKVDPLGIKKIYRKKGPMEAFL